MTTQTQIRTERENEQTVYVCPKCRGIEFVFEANGVPMLCARCADDVLMVSYPANTIDDLADMLTDELGKVGPMTDLIHARQAFAGVIREKDGVEIADAATISDVPVITRKRVADRQSMMPDRMYSRMAAFTLTEIPCEESL